MATTYDGAVEALYRGPLDAFVAERKRLAGELKAGGDKDGAARLVKLGRPSISAWAVNQLYWHEREAFDRLLATAARLRRGEHDAASEHQRALSALRALTATLLTGAGHAAPESTLRRVTTTLAALAVTGGFEPDPPGALVADREPPGFEALALGDAGFAGQADETARRKKRERAEEEQRRFDEQRRLEEERTRKRAERQKLEEAFLTAQTEAAAQQRDAERLRRELNAAEFKLEKALSALAKLKEALDRLGLS